MRVGIFLALLVAPPLAAQEAQNGRTLALVEPVTQQRRVAYMVNQDHRTLVMGCSNVGSGDLAIRINLQSWEQPYVTDFAPVQHRFGAADRMRTAEWRANDDDLYYFGTLFGGNRTTAEFLDAFARDSVLYVRFKSSDSETTLTFKYGSNSGTEIRKMLTACRPKRVMAELVKMGSPLAAPNNDPIPALAD